MKKVAKALKCGVASIWRWVNNGTHNKVRTDKPRNKTTILSFIKLQLENKNYLTILDLQKEILGSFNTSLSRQCISLSILKLGFSRKRLQKRGNVNVQRVSSRYEEFKEKYKDAKSKHTIVVAVDEVGFDQQLIPLYGYSKKGTKAFCKTHPTRRQRLNMIMAIDNKNNHYFEFVKGSTCSNDFNNFIKNLKWPSGTKILMDNASLHKTKLITNTLQTKSYEGLYIPPYSPDCNPIENVFSVIKNRYRKISTDHSLQPEDILQDILKDLKATNLYKKVFANMEKHLNHYTLP